MKLPGIYAQWRARNWAAHTLAERPDGSPLTERLLQLIWQYQRLQRDQLQTSDGRPVRILHPGFWNQEAGPDFRGAVIQFGEALACHGDVEVDLSPHGWHAHHHDLNPAYKNVILHVVWEGEAAPTLPKPLPTLPLKTRLDAPLEELGLWLRTEPRAAPPNVVGKCTPALHELSEEQRAELLCQAAQARLQAKAGQFQARARQVGWDQALWEGLLAGLGFKQNVWPMRRIAEILPALLGTEPRPDSSFALQARLFGVSGLLPSDLGHARPSSHAYLRQIWNLWWRDQEKFAELILPRSAWRLGCLRPANNPLRRLALAAHWLSGPDLVACLERWFENADPDSNLPSSLLKALSAGEDEFWSYHWSFSSARTSGAQPLLGPQRLTDLAINVILPWFWIRATLGKNRTLQKLAEECYFAWPQAEDNTVLRLARGRLFGGATAAPGGTAAMQQAIFQIVRDFCDYSNALCTNCPFPQLLADVVCT